jgi:hypothetical protein
MTRFLALLLALLLTACSAKPDLQLPDGMVEFELYEIVTEMNPMWDPVERAVTDVRLLAGRQVAADRYEFDAEYEVQCLAIREPMSAAELQRMADSMRAQGRQQEWEKMEARRKASEQYLAERVSDMKPGDKKWFRDTFKLVRMGDSWVPEDMAEQMKADLEAARR